MSYFLFTFTPQITEQELFEQFLIIFIPELKKYPEYSYSVEKDGTLNKHIHAIWRNDNPAVTDASKGIKQYFLSKKIFINFKASLFAKQTTARNAFDNRKVNDEDFLKVLGYVNKETDCPRREYNFTNEKMLEAVEYYYTCEHIDKTIIKTDLILLTSKNIHIHIKDFVEKHDFDVGNYHMVKHQMRKHKYCFSQVGKVQETFRELEEIIYPERYETEDHDIYTNNNSHAYLTQELYNAQQLRNKYKNLLDSKGINYI